MLAAKEVAPSLPLVAQVTIDEDGNCLDGSDPETFVPKLEEWGADVIGCNCSVGPVAMLDAMERVRAATSLPLAAQPNAGIPRSVEGRNIYLCSPEYMASYARKFVAAGVRAGRRMLRNHAGAHPGDEVGAARWRSARKGSLAAQVVGSQAAPKAVPAVALESRSLLGAKLARGEFVTMVEIVPPKGIDIAQGGRGRALSEVGGRGRGQHSRQSARLGSHEQPGACRC